MHTIIVYKTFHAGLKTHVYVIELNGEYPLLNVHLTCLTNGVHDPYIYKRQVQVSYN